jgi:hypothetical protein
MRGERKGGNEFLIIFIRLGESLLSRMVKELLLAAGIDDGVLWPLMSIRCDIYGKLIVMSILEIFIYT